MFIEMKNLENALGDPHCGAPVNEARGDFAPASFSCKQKRARLLSFFFASFAILLFAPKRADTPFFLWRHLHHIHFPLKNGHRGSLGLSLAKRRVLTASPYRDSSPARAQGYTGVPCFPSAPPEDTPDSVRSPGSLFQRSCNTSSMEVPQAWKDP